MVIKVKNMDYTELYKFLSDETGKVIDDKSPNWKIDDDLKIYGDDANEFLIKFSKKFNIKIENFNFENYFNPEIDKISLFFFNIFNRKAKKMDFTINSLKEAIKKGELK